METKFLVNFYREAIYKILMVKQTNWHGVCAVQSKTTILKSQKRSLQSATGKLQITKHIYGMREVDFITAYFPRTP